MKNCPKFGKVILVAMVHELYKSGLGEVTFDKVSIFSFFILFISYVDYEYGCKQEIIWSSPGVKGRMCLFDRALVPMCHGLVSLRMKFLTLYFNLSGQLCLAWPLLALLYPCFLMSPYLYSSNTQIQIPY